MQAIELISNEEEWFSFVLLFSLVLVAFLKLIKPNQLTGYGIAFFKPGFFKKETEEFAHILTPFKLMLFGFSVIIISLVFYSFFNTAFFGTQGFQVFLKILTFISTYIFTKCIIDVFLVNLLSIKENVSYFLLVKYGYLFTVCLLIFPVVILNKYTFKNNYLLLITFIILLAFRAILILFNNKKLILAKLFYFILYFCALEIAPLLILYKTTTT